MRPMLGLVGAGRGVKVGNGVGSALSDVVKSAMLKVVVGINKHSPMTITTKIKPIGKRKPRGEFRLENNRRWDMGEFYSHQPPEWNLTWRFLAVNHLALAVPFWHDGVVKHGLYFGFHYAIMIS